MLSYQRRALLAALGLVLFHVCFAFAGRQDGLWLPGVGVGLTLLAWCGFAVAPLLALDLVLASWLHGPERGWSAHVVESLLLAVEMTFAWWCYQHLAKGSRRLDDPRSATSFLIIVPGAVTVAGAVVHAGLRHFYGEAAGDFWALASTLGVSRMLGILAVTPLLLVEATPWLERLGCVEEAAQRVVLEREDSLGETIELVGLAAGNVVLTLALVTLQVQRGDPGWGLWGVSLLLVVWTSLRQGLRGGVIIAGIASLIGLTLADALGAGAFRFSPLQGNLLAQCSTALLVGASSSWIRAGEARYRRVAGHVPVVLYSVRLPGGGLPQPATARPDSKLDLSPGAAIVHDAEVTLVTQASKKIFGLEPAALEGPFSRWMERVHPADRELLQAALGQLGLQKQPVTCEYRLWPAGMAVEMSAPLPSGALPPVTWVRDTLAPHHTAEGRLDGWDGVLEDITEARALSQTVRRTTGMLQALVANLPTGVFFVQGPLGQPVLVNARARQLLGQREDMAAGIDRIAKVYRLHRPDGSEYPADELPIAKALHLGLTCMANDVVVHRPDGRWVPLITWAAPVDVGGVGKPEAAVWVLEDFSAMQQAKERYQNLVESLPISLIQLDGQHRVIYCNPAALALTGYSAADFQNPELRNKMIVPEDQPVFAQALEQARAGQPSRFELRFFAKSGEPKIGYMLVQPQLHQGRVAGATCLMLDVSVQRRLEESLHNAQRLELMGKLAGGTVHDFNNMLTALMGMAAIARGGLPPEHPVHDDITRIIDIGVQASELAGQLLAFSKQRRTQPRPVDLNTVVFHTLKILKGLMPAPIKIISKPADGDVWVNADETQLKQVVMNLCLNARDAMPEGGALTIRTVRDQSGDKPRVGCIVRDSGHGMDETTQARIFEPFFSTKERGSGLGLAVVQQIIHRFGGSIAVSSRPGEGTTMEVWLEACPAPVESEVVF